MMSPLGREYFSRYGSNTPGYKKTDYSKSWRHYTFTLDEILEEYRDYFGEDPETFLDLGAADGSLVKKALQHGLKARGMENSPYIHGRIKEAKIKALIKKADAARETRRMKANAYDVVVECAAQYLPPENLDGYLENVFRICSHMTCLLIDAKNYEGIRTGPHIGVRTFETKSWWRKKMLSHGYTKCKNDFYFFKK